MLGCRSLGLFLAVVVVGPCACVADDSMVVTQAALRQAVLGALPWIEAGAKGHRKQRDCFACHNQGLPVMAMTMARDRGFAVNEKEIKKQKRFIAEFLERNQENYLAGKGQGGQVDTAGYALWTLHTAGWPNDEITGAVTEYLLLYQKDLDHWKTGSKRPPTEASSFTTTYVALRSLAAYGEEERRERIERRVGDAQLWLLTTEAVDTEDRVFRLRGLVATDADGESIAAARDELLATRRDDGGWAQLDTLDSDAYATATALVALHESGMATDDPIYERGLAFLLENRLDDGTWYVTTRSKPFQTYFETGFPHGEDQYLSCAATSWAVMAMLNALPKVAPVDDTETRGGTLDGE